MLQFLCSQYHMDYVVQPLPVDHMALRMTGENEVELTWRPVADALEPTAIAEKYIVYTRIGDGDFDNGVLAVSYTHLFEVWDNEVEIKVAYQSPCGDWYEVSEMFPIVH